MILYHFTTAHALKGIMTSGLRKGALPWNMNGGRVGLQPGWQWLTRNQEFSQEWCRRMDERLPFRRDEYRITINIPKIAESRVVAWVEIAGARAPDSAEWIASFPEHREWLCFRGPIPQPWFLAVDRNPFPRFSQTPMIIPP